MLQRCCLIFLFFISTLGFTTLSHATDDIEYRFERMWPDEKTVYLSGPSEVVVATDGSIYIADTYNSLVVNLEVDGRFVQNWPIETPSGGGNPVGIALAADGSLYVLESTYGGVKQFTPDGNLIQSWGANGNDKWGFSGPQAIALGVNDDIYVADTYKHRVVQFTTQGVPIRVWGEYGQEQGQFNSPKGIAVASDGSVYVADTENHRIQQFTAEGIFIRTWGEEGYASGIGGLFHRPEGVAVATDNTVYVTDTRGTIQQFTAEGRFIRMWGVNGSGSGGELSNPRGIAVANDGSVYVADSGNNRIHQFTAEGELIRSIESGGSAKGEFNQPRDMELGIDGTIYVLDDGNNRIQQFEKNGRFIRSLDITILTGRQISWNDGMGVAPDGSIFVIVTGDLFQFNANGDVIRSWTMEKQTSLRDSNGIALFYPTDIAIASDGTFYVLDNTYVQGKGRNYRVVQFTATGQFIRTWGRTGSGTSEFVQPNEITVSKNGDVYVVDNGNGRIQQFTANGDFIRDWGRVGNSPIQYEVTEEGDSFLFTNDGNPHNGEGEFFSPTDISIAVDGTVYVVDEALSRIQQFTANGEFISIIWSGSGTGVGQLNNPHGLVVDDEDSVYVSDFGNNRIQKFSLNSKTVEVDQNNETIAHPYKAIILAGGGAKIGGRINDIWDGTWRVSLKAHKALTRQAFVVHDEIKFLTAGRTDMDLDNNGQFDDLEAATKASLQSAITDWAADAKDVVIYLANHGGPGNFRINGTEVLTAEELDTWVSQLEARIPGTVTVIIEACNSASFFNPLSQSNRYLFASAEANQSAVISNDGLNSFSYFLWSEIGTGALLKNAFEDARQAMSATVIGTTPQNAQADTDGNQLFEAVDLDNLGDYCLGNCNPLASDAPFIESVTPATTTLNNANGPLFQVKVNSLQPILRVWASVQRPDDITIDPNQPLQFDTVNLSCNDQKVCEGRYDKFDMQGEYRLNFYAMDDKYEVSFPESLIVTQNQGSSVAPVEYDENLQTVYLRDVVVGNEHYQAALELQDGKFKVIVANPATKSYSPAAEFNFDTGLLTIPHAQVFGQAYQATFQHLGNLEFQLISAAPK